jgi:hypothetical protein
MPLSGKSVFGYAARTLKQNNELSLRASFFFITGSSGDTFICYLVTYS